MADIVEGLTRRPSVTPKRRPAAAGETPRHADRAPVPTIVGPLDVPVLVRQTRAVDQTVLPARLALVGRAEVD